MNYLNNNEHNDGNKSYNENKSKNIVYDCLKRDKC